MVLFRRGNVKVVARDGCSGSKLLLGLVAVSESVAARLNGGDVHRWLPTAVSAERLVGRIEGVKVFDNGLRFAA